VWTNALAAGFRPASSLAVAAEETGKFFFTAMIVLADSGSGTKYTATVIHSDEASCKTHADMGFKEGWGTALDQLVELAKKM
jgi:uncharacterized protein YndB with AHSA1/START domain